MSLEADALLVVADRLAEQAHDGAVDKAGVAYIGHPRRVAKLVADRGGSVEQQAAALLHDVLEDTEITADQMRERGIPDNVIDIVTALTKREGEPHEQAVRRAASDPMARLVKRCDVDDNRDPDRLALLPRELRSRLEDKYARAVEILDEADAL